MKMTIAYQSDEQKEADTVAAAMRSLLPAVKVRESDRHPPFKHIYMTIKKPEKPHGSGPGT